MVSGVDVGIVVVLGFLGLFGFIGFLLYLGFLKQEESKKARAQRLENKVQFEHSAALKKLEEDRVIFVNAKKELEKRTLNFKEQEKKFNLTKEEIRSEVAEELSKNHEKKDKELIEREKLYTSSKLEIEKAANKKVEDKISVLEKNLALVVQQNKDWAAKYSKFEVETNKLLSESKEDAAEDEKLWLEEKNKLEYELSRVKTLLEQTKTQLKLDQLNKRVRQKNFIDAETDDEADADEEDSSSGIEVVKPKETKEVNVFEQSFE